MVGDVTGPSAAPPLIKYSSPCREDQRLCTESKIFSNYCNISKTLGGSIHPPTSYHGGSMNLHVRPRVNYILDKCKLPQQRKFNEVSPVFKEDCCLIKSNCRPITICRSCRKYLELYFAQDIRPYFERIFPRTYSDTGKKYGTDTALVRTVEKGTGPT